MRYSNVQRAIWRARAVLGKGSSHLLNLVRWRVAQIAQRTRGTWSPAAVDERSFLAQLDLPSARRAMRRGDLAAAKKMAEARRRASGPLRRTMALGAPPAGEDAATIVSSEKW